MSKTVNLQVPMDEKLRDSAVKAAGELGFSSLQELFRVFAKQLSSKEVGVSFEKFPTVQLSKKAIKRYDKISKEIRKGKNVYHAKDVDDLMRQLHGD